MIATPIFTAAIAATLLTDVVTGAPAALLVGAVKGDTVAEAANIMGP
jgi:hypothetical protein